MILYRIISIAVNCAALRYTVLFYIARVLLKERDKERGEIIRDIYRESERMRDRRRRRENIVNCAVPYRAVL